MLSALPENLSAQFRVLRNPDLKPCSRSERPSCQRCKRICEKELLLVHLSVSVRTEAMMPPSGSCMQIFELGLGFYAECVVWLLIIHVGP